MIFHNKDAKRSHFYCFPKMLKSVQPTLSHLQSPPEQMQSQRNYGSFLSKSHLRGMILLTMLAQNRPKSKRQYFNRAIFFFKIKRGEATGICLYGWQVLKSVQSALSDLKRPPDLLQSQCNYRPFIT